jgi:hypothetical protein
MCYSWNDVNNFPIVIQVLIWDVEAQPNRHAVLGASESRPDMIWFIVLFSVPDILFFGTWLTSIYCLFRY